MTIVGENFMEGEFRCRFGNQESPAGRLTSTQIGCKTPPGTISYVDVFVESLNSLRASNPLTYRYIAAPDLVNVVPSVGPILGGTSVTALGSSFEAGHAYCVFGDTLYVLGEILSPHSLLCRSPAVDEASVVMLGIAPSLAEISVARVPFQFQKVASITSFTPTQASDVGGSRITIRGQYFSNSDGASCRFGLVSASFQFLSSSAVVCTTPRHAQANVTILSLIHISEPTRPY